MTGSGSGIGETIRRVNQRVRSGATGQERAAARSAVARTSSAVEDALAVVGYRLDRLSGPRGGD
ncbi:hypothetical protein GCM10027261_17130 [Geodermatophilus arenarius]